LVRWPGLVPPRTEINDIFSAENWATTLVAAAGEPDIKSERLQGYNAAGKSFKVHLDGYDQRDLLARKGPNQRREFLYWTDDGNLAGLRATDGAAALADAAQPALEPVRAGSARGGRLRPMVRGAMPSCSSRCRRWWGSIS
jgi:arylsulfatase A-like enzyme